MYKIPPFPVSTAQDSDESDSSVDYEELAKYLDVLEPSCLRLTGSNKTYVGYQQCVRASLPFLQTWRGGLSTRSENLGRIKQSKVLPQVLSPVA